MFSYAAWANRKEEEHPEFWYSKETQMSLQIPDCCSQASPRFLRAPPAQAGSPVQPVSVGPTVPEAARESNAADAHLQPEQGLLEQLGDATVQPRTHAVRSLAVSAASPRHSRQLGRISKHGQGTARTGAESHARVAQIIPSAQSAGGHSQRVSPKPVCYCAQMEATEQITYTPRGQAVSPKWRTVVRPRRGKLYQTSSNPAEVCLQTPVRTAQSLRLDSIAHQRNGRLPILLCLHNR